MHDSFTVGASLFSVPWVARTKANQNGLGLWLPGFLQAKAWFEAGMCLPLLTICM